MSDIIVRRFDVPKLNSTIFIGYEKQLDDVTFLSETDFPANGGCRIMSYSSEADAVNECRSLSKVMSWKHRVFPTGFRGGKIVVRCPDPHQIERKVLMSEIAKALSAFDGRVITGCDLNTFFKDMKLITEFTARNNPRTNFVLAALESKCDPNVATAYGVVAAVQTLAAVIQTKEKMVSLLVLGVGKVGSKVAQILNQIPNFSVLVADKQPGRAANVVPEAINVSDKDWTKLNFDILVPCAASHIIDKHIAEQLNCRGICGSSNIPITDGDAMSVLERRNILFVPEAISSAGAVLEDSVEFYDPEVFRDIHPSYVYSFISSLIEQKTQQFLRKLTEEPRQSTNDVLHSILDMNLDGIPVGQKFSRWISTNPIDFDVVIVGAGMAGTACAYSLAKEDFSGSVALIDQEAVCNIHGSSHGDSRMYREMYSDPFYSKLMSQSLKMWYELEKTTNTKLLDKNGLVFFGSSTTGETAEGSVLGAAETMKNLGIPHEIINNSEELCKRFKGLCPKEDDIGVFSLGDGSIRASAACEVMAKYAKANGLSLLERTPVLEIFTEGIGSAKALIHLSDGRIIRVREKLVLTTGAWTTRLLKEQFNIDMNAKVQMIAWGHFELPDDAADLPQWFCFRNGTHNNLPIDGDQHGLYYGFPSVPSKGNAATKRVVKIGTDFTPDFAYTGYDVPKANQRKIHDDLYQDIKTFARDHWPILGNVVDMQDSPYHVTPSQDFVLGSLPQLPQVILFCGESGRAFKFAPLIGGVLADLIQGRKERIDISRFDPQRVISNTSTKPDQEEAMGQEVNENGVLGKSHVPFGKKGDGVYSMATQGCFDVINSFEAHAINEFEDYLLSENASNRKAPISLCDFGAADGGTSLPLWTEIIRKCRQLAPSREIEIKYEDQPNADYQSLFYYTQGLLRVPGRTGKTYLEEEGGDKVFVSAIGTSFHKQCVPSSSLHFGFSSTAMHWLSRQPDLSLPSGVIHHSQLNENDAVSKAWAKGAAEDWERILLARAVELQSCGRTVIVNFCIDAEGQSLGNTKTVPRSMFDEMTRHWKEMMKIKRISKEEFDQLQILNYYRTVEEMTSVLTDKSSKVYQAGLRLEKVLTAVTPCPYRAKFLKGGEDAKTFAKNLILTMRTWSNSSFESALDKSRSSKEITEICDEFFSRYADAVALKPHEHGMDYVHALVSVSKI